MHLTSGVFWKNLNQLLLGMSLRKPGLTRKMETLTMDGELQLFHCTPHFKSVILRKAVPRVSFCLNLCSYRTVGDWQRNAPFHCRQHGCPKRSCPPFLAVTTARAVRGPAEIMQTSNRRICTTVS